MYDIVTYSGGNIVELWDTMLTRAYDKTNPQADTMALLAINFIALASSLISTASAIE